MRFLISEFTGLGDFIQKTPMIKAIHQFDESAEVFVIGDNRWGAINLVRNSPLISSVHNVLASAKIEIPKDYNNATINKLLEVHRSEVYAKTFQWLNQKSFQAFFCGSDSDIPACVRKAIIDSNCEALYEHIDIRVLAQRSFWAWLKDRFRSEKIKYVPILNGRHDIDANYDLLETYLSRPIERGGKTWIAVESDGCVQKDFKLEEKKYICLQPGGANGSSSPKIWDTKNFVALSQKISEERPEYKVVLVGDDGDRRKIIDQYTWPKNVVNTAGETTIGQLVNVIENADCLVVQDSGIMHIGNALGKRLVALYGPTNYSATQPRGEKSRILFSKTEAFGVMHSSRLSEKALADKYPGYEAMSGICVDDVFLALTEQIDDE